MSGVPMHHPTKQELRNQFQARMWREYAQMCSGELRDWVSQVLKVTRTDCIARARAALAQEKK